MVCHSNDLFSNTFTWYYLFNLLVVTLEPVDEIVWCDHSNKTSSAVHSHSAIYYFNLLVLTIEPVEEILWCDHSNETSSAFIWHGPFFIITNNFLKYNLGSSSKVDLEGALD